MPGTFVHGIAASENIDSSGEIISIAGLDISSLERDGVLNWAHKNDTPSQVVGKVLKARKIFSDADCEDEHQLKFWGKCKVPYVYIVGELFDEQDHTSAKDLAAMFRYDAAKQDQNTNNVIGFSIEGSKINKEGNVITHSIGRKVTCDPFPCNKMAVAEMVQKESAKPKDSIDELFLKTESFVEIELIKFEEKSKLWELLKKEDPKKHADKLGIDPFKKEEGLSAGGASNALSGVGPSSPSLMSSEKKMNKAMPKLSLVGSMGTKLGSTKSGKDIFSHGKVAEYKGMSHADHAEASTLHQKASDASKDLKMKDFHRQKSQLHAAASRSVEAKGKQRQEMAHGQRMVPAGSSPSSSSATPRYGKVFHPERSGIAKPPGPIKKALDAGSSLAAPSELSGGAALGKESIDKKMKKSKWLSKAKDAYAKWEKREQFEQFMSNKMPHLTKGEIRAIGQTMALSKSLKK